MKELIHRYLDENYYIAEGKLYPRKQKSIPNHSIIIYHMIVSRDIKFCEELIDHLYIIFGLRRKQLKGYVKSWCINKDFDFSRFWNLQASSNIIFSTQFEYYSLNYREVMLKRYNINKNEKVDTRLGSGRGTQIHVQKALQLKRFGGRRSGLSYGYLQEMRRTYNTTIYDMESVQLQAGG